MILDTFNAWTFSTIHEQFLYTGIFSEGKSIRSSWKNPWGQNPISFAGHTNYFSNSPNFANITISRQLHVQLAWLFEQTFSFVYLSLSYDKNQFYLAFLWTAQKIVNLKWLFDYSIWSFSVPMAANSQFEALLGNRWHKRLTFSF